LHEGAKTRRRGEKKDEKIERREKDRRRM